ncbi:PhaM family polyhydroxyalkanoate granule multifunctional regulatory protein [Duganella sp.]|uniref:PhaM family polyhydroxyalkanoate granule multifunctional regulatory protein n=1 Tax=Duganella sp. TaxID=1904440 RepID=UPI0031D65AD7
MAHNPMNDTLDFVKNLWGSMSVPGLTAPTLSVEELDKKINDLKAVETWLNLNMSMLRGSIQALEVQRGTIATLKSVGASLASAVNTGVNDKSIFDANPYASAFFHHAREADKAQAEPEAKAPPEPEVKAEEPKAPPAGASSGQPNAWWNLLQEQFKQAVSTAMASESMMTDAAVKFAAAAAGASAQPAARPEASAAQAAPVKPAAVKKPPAKKPAAKKPAARPAPDKP